METRCHWGFSRPWAQEIPAAGWWRAGSTALGSAPSIERGAPRRRRYDDVGGDHGRLADQAAGPCRGAARSTAPSSSCSPLSACGHGDDHDSARSRHSSRPCRLVRRASRGTRETKPAAYPSCAAPSACGLRSPSWWSAARTPSLGWRPLPALQPQGTDSEACLR